MELLLWPSGLIKHLSAQIDRFDPSIDVQLHLLVIICLNIESNY